MEIAIILGLVLFNGVFSMSEMAVVSARRLRLEHWSRQGNGKAARALALHNSPNVFLSTVQIGITLIGILSGAVGEAVLADDIKAFVETMPSIAEYSESIATVVVVVSITFLSLVIGELVPKRLALLSPEKIACLVATPMHILSRIAAPAVHLLSLSVELMLWLMRAKPSTEPQVTEEEVHALIEEGARTGVFLEEERDLLKNVIRLADRPIEAIMTPRSEIVWLDLNDTQENITREIIESPQARYPVARGNLDRIEGVVQTKDLVAQLMEKNKTDFKSILRQPMLVPLSISPLQILEFFKNSPLHMAFVVGTNAEIKGVVTLHDILEAIVGSLPTEGQPAEDNRIQREEGSWLLDGLLSIEELKETLGLTNLPDEELAGYETLGGFILSHIGRLPHVGDHFIHGGWRFEVVDMDGRRIDRVLAIKLDTSDDTNNEM